MNFRDDTLSYTLASAIELDILTNDDDIASLFQKTQLKDPH